MFHADYFIIVSADMNPQNMISSQNFSLDPSNQTTQNPNLANIQGVDYEDVVWILTSSFIVMTMQSGYALFQAGSVTAKNELSIMMKNVIDMSFSGISFWTVGFGVCCGQDETSTAFYGRGHFLVDSLENNMGVMFAMYIFRLASCAMATTIGSGIMNERIRLVAYICFSFFNTISYTFPAHWMWDQRGFLKRLGSFDFAGAGVIHMMGGVAGMTGALLLGPRTGRYENGHNRNPLPNPVNSILGMFILWWGWLGLNCGATFGITGAKWKIATKVAANTITASFVSGAFGLLFSYAWSRGSKWDVSDLVNGIIGGLVSVSGACAIVEPWEALAIGLIGGILVVLTPHLFNRFEVDDPAEATSVHGVCGLWGLIAIGLFANIDLTENMTNGLVGLFHGGGFYFLGVQLLAAVCIMAWTCFTTCLIFLPLKYTVGIRLVLEAEVLGSDYVEHGGGAQNLRKHGLWFGDWQTNDNGAAPPTAAPQNGATTTNMPV